MRVGCLMFLVCGAGYFHGTLAYGSPWQTMDYPIEVSNITCIYEDEATNSLLIAGMQIVHYATDSNMNVVMRFHDGVWDTLAYLNHPAYTLLRYNDTLVVGGAFTTINDSVVSRLAYYDNGTWKAYGLFSGPVRKLAEISGILYAVGGFTSCDGYAATGIAYRNSGQWENLGTIQTTNIATMHDIVEYSGRLIVGGNFSSTGFSDLAQFSAGEWQPVGPAGLLGGISSVDALIVYNDDLIIAGTIDISAGNAGHAIMGWNGIEFFPLNIGPQYIQGSYQYYYRVNSLLVHQGILVAGGGFNYADLVPASRIAVWDGQAWCSLGVEIGGEVRALGLYEDALIVATWGDQTFNGVDMNNLAAYTGALDGDSCSVATVVDEFGAPDGKIVLFPNPTTGTLHLLDLPTAAHHAEVYDLTGRKVLQQRIAGQPLDVQALATGTYLLTVRDGAGHALGTRRFVRE